MPETSMQAINYHPLPRVVMSSLHHAFWGTATIDLTPGYGELCADNVTNNVSYVAVCQTQFQKKYILTTLVDQVLLAMKDPSKPCYVPAYAKELADQEKSTGKAKATGVAPTTAAATGAAGKRQAATEDGGANKAPKTTTPAAGSTPTAETSPTPSTATGTALSPALQAMLASAKAAQG